MARRPRVRDYKAEYWRPKAKRLIVDTRFDVFYDERGGINAPRVQDLGRELGWDRLYHAVELKNEMERLYQAGRVAEAHRLWLDRDDDFPDWFWHYHKWTA
jgi:hypothetical protein